MSQAISRSINKSATVFALLLLFELDRPAASWWVGSCVVTSATLFAIVSSLEPVFVRSQNLDSGSGAVFCVICAQPSWDTQIGPVELTFLTA
jgi:hypothetical protein